jgi:hypothetical protein
MHLLHTTGNLFALLKLSLNGIVFERVFRRILLAVLLSVGRIRLNKFPYLLLELCLLLVDGHHFAAWLILNNLTTAAGVRVISSTAKIATIFGTIQS